MATETIKARDKDHQEQMYRDLRATGNSKERQAVKYSEPAPTGERDTKGRPVYTTAYFVAYPAGEAVPEAA